MDFMTLRGPISKKIIFPCIKSPYFEILSIHGGKCIQILRYLRLLDSSVSSLPFAFSRKGSFYLSYLIILYLMVWISPTFHPTQVMGYTKTFLKIYEKYCSVKYDLPLRFFLKIVSKLKFLV